jgi:AraC-like DNA-binding protein
VSLTVPVIRSASLHGYRELVLSLGANPSTLMRRVGLTITCLKDPETLINLHSARQLLELSASETGAEDFGLRLASTRKLSNMGMLSLVLREEPTAREALNSLSRYLRLINRSLSTHIEDHEDLVIIREELLYGHSGGMRQSMELAVGVMFRTLKELLGQRWNPRQVCFTHRAPKKLDSHRAFFAAPLTFNDSFSGMVCSAKDLQVSLHSLDSGMAGYARNLLDQALRKDVPNTTESARQLICALLPGGRCTADQVAQHLSIDRRTLHRHLQQDGETFSSLLQAIREEFSLRQLTDADRPLSEQASLLGFSSASAFAYWFRSTFDCTVTQWRNRPADFDTATLHKYQ